MDECKYCEGHPHPTTYQGVMELLESDEMCECCKGDLETDLMDSAYVDFLKAGK